MKIQVSAWVTYFRKTSTHQRRENSNYFDTFGTLRGFLARDQIAQDTRDWFELSGVDERIDAVVEKANEQCHEKDDLASRVSGKDI